MRDCLVDQLAHSLLLLLPLTAVADAVLLAALAGPAAALPQQHGALVRHRVPMSRVSSWQLLRPADCSMCTLLLLLLLLLPAIHP
jgi:hypothetical protein